jgi:hypothetical protein
MVCVILENIQMRVLMWSNKDPNTLKRILIWSNRDPTISTTRTELEILHKLDLNSIWGGEKASL